MDREMAKNQFINKIHRSGYCIYCIENVSNGRKYIGQATNITFRRESHRQALIKGCHPNTKLQEDFNSGDIFVIRALEYFPSWTSKNLMNGKEHVYMKKYKSNICGYNVTAAPLKRKKCRPMVEKYKVCQSKVDKAFSRINKNGGLSFLKIYDLCHILSCQPGDLLEYIPDEE